VIIQKELCSFTDFHVSPPIGLFLRFVFQERIDYNKMGNKLDLTIWFIVLSLSGNGKTTTYGKLYLNLFNENDISGINCWNNIYPYGSGLFYSFLVF
jgi:hypothetical protein